MSAKFSFTHHCIGFFNAVKLSFTFNFVSKGAVIRVIKNRFCLRAALLNYV